MYGRWPKRNERLGLKGIFDSRCCCGPLCLGPELCSGELAETKACVNFETVSAVRTEAPVATSTHGRTGAAGALLRGVQGEDGDQIEGLFSTV